MPGSEFLNKSSKYCSKRPKYIFKCRSHSKVYGKSDFLMLIKLKYKGNPSCKKTLKAINQNITLEAEKD